MNTTNLEYYRFFYYAATLGSLTRTAETLHVSQPAVSQAIHQLETDLGTALFERTARGVRLTRQGELLFSYVKKGYEQIITGEEKLHQMLNLDIGEIHIGASDMTLHYFLLPYLEAFHEKYPGVKVVVTNGPTPETLENITRGSIDFAVVSGPLQELYGADPAAPFSSISALSDMEIIPVRDIHDVFVGGAELSKKYKGREITYQELASLPIIALEEKTSSRRYMDAQLLANGVQLQPEFELATSDMIVQFAIRNLGVGCVVRDFAEDALRDGSLFEFQFKSPFPARQFYVMNNRNDLLPTAAVRLLEMIRSDTMQG